MPTLQLPPTISHRKSSASTGQAGLSFADSLKRKKTEDWDEIFTVILQKVTPETKVNQRARVRSLQRLRSRVLR